VDDKRQTIVGFSPEEKVVLERVRDQQGLESIEQAAEWLAKSGIRKAAKKTTGRGRALYPVDNRGRE
jgi:hypothetical protein